MSFVIPPSTQTFSLVMKLALFEQRNSAISAMSSGLPTRPTGYCTASAPPMSESVVSIHPGDMLLTGAIPAKLTAMAWVSAAMPPWPQCNSPSAAGSFGHVRKIY